MSFAKFGRLLRQAGKTQTSGESFTLDAIRSGLRFQSRYSCFILLAGTLLHISTYTSVADAWLKIVQDLSTASQHRVRLDRFPS